MRHEIAVIGAVLLFASSARASDTEADVFFTLGREAMQRGDPSTACRLFRKSYELDAALGTVLNLGRCEEELGRFASASERYRAVMAGAEPGSDRYVYAEKRLNALEPRIPRLILRRKDASAGDQIFVDRRRLTDDEIDAPIPLDPGEHVVELRGAKGSTRSYDVVLKEAERRELEISPSVELAPRAPAVTKPRTTASPSKRRPAAAPARPDQVSGDTTLGWVLAGVGAAGLALSGIAAIVVLDRKATVERECDENLVCRNETGKQAADSGKTWGTIGTISFVAGVLGAGAGTYLLLTSEPEHKSAFVSLHTEF